MELASFVALGSPLAVLSLAGTELAEVFGSFGCDVLKQLHLNPS